MDVWRAALATAGALWAAACAAPPEPQPAHPDGSGAPVWPGELLVALEHDAALEALDARLALSEASPIGRARPHRPRWRLLRYRGPLSPFAAARRAATLPGVRAAQPNFAYTASAAPSDPFYADQTAHQLTGAELAWDVSTGSDAVVIAVLGSGIQLDHPELAPNLWHNAGETAGNGVDDDGNGYVDDLGGWDFQNDDADPSGGDHETRVAGVIAAAANNGAGGAGVMWSAALMPLRLVYSSVQVAEAIDYAVDNGAHVLNLSFGIYLPQVFGDDSLVGEALARAETAEVVVVASAGNDGVMTPSFPAANGTVLGVGSVNDSDQRSGFSNAGAWLDVAAPGEGLVTANNGDQIVQVSGTSFAAPYVTGLAGLLRAVHPTWTAAELRAAILVSGDRLATDRFVGYTRVNLGRALTGAAAPLHASVRLPEDGSVVGQPTVTVVGLANGDGYTLAYRPAGGGWTDFASGAAVIDGALGTLTLAGVPFGPVELRLAATRGAENVESTVRVYHGPPFYPGFPTGAFGAVHSSPTFGDLDGDGRLELLVADTEHFLHAWTAAGAPVWFAPLWMNERLPHMPALADLDGNGDVEIVVTAHDDGGGGAVYLWEHDDWETRRWAAALGRTSGAAVVAPLAPGGGWAIVAADDDATEATLHLLDQDGQAIDGWPQTLSSGARASPVVADLDGDRVEEIFVGTSTQEYLFFADGTLAPGWPRPVSGGFGDGAAGDLDGDGQVELVSVQRTAVELVRFDGTVLPGWPQPLPDSQYNRVSLADLDNDERPEVILGLKNGEVRVWRSNGAPLAGWPQSTGGEIWAAVAAGDLDGDGGVDLVTSCTDGLVYAWAADGTPLADFPRHLDGGSGSSAALTDLDGDGDVDLFVGGSDLRWQVYGWDLAGTYDPLTSEWSRARHDARNTAYYPRRFALQAAAAAGGGVQLTWAAPLDVPAPSAYALWRDGRFVSRGAERSVVDIPPSLGAHRYGVVALDAAGTVLARSRLVTADVEALPPPPGADPTALVGGCGCRTGGAPLLAVVALLAGRRRRQNEQRQLVQLP